jgi:hypothetical protein
MAMMSRGLVLLVVLLFVVVLTAAAADDWREEFNDICAQVDVVDSLSREESG